MKFKDYYREDYFAKVKEIKSKLEKLSNKDYSEFKDAVFAVSDNLPKIQKVLKNIDKEEAKIWDDIKNLSAKSNLLKII